MPLIATETRTGFEASARTTELLWALAATDAMSRGWPALRTETKLSANPQIKPLFRIAGIGWERFGSNSACLIQFNWSSLPE